MSWTLQYPSAAHSGQKTDSSPSVVAYRGELWYASNDLNSHQPVIASSDGDIIWTTQAKPKMPEKESMVGAPSLVTWPGPVEGGSDGFNDLHLFVRGNSGKLLYSKYKGTVWTDPETLFLGGDKHNAIAHGDSMYCVNVSQDGSCSWAQWKTNTWTESKDKTETDISGKPGLITWNSKLYLFGISGNSHGKQFVAYELLNDKWQKSVDLQLDKLPVERRSLQELNAAKLPPTHINQVTGISACAAVDHIIFMVTYGSGTPFTTHRLNLGTTGDWGPTETHSDFQTTDVPASAFLHNKIHCLYSYTSMKQVFMAKRDASPISNMESWMSRLDQNLSITKINIPGTHDALASNDRFWRTSTQRMNVLTQLRAGIRYLDIRGGLSKGTVITKDGVLKTAGKVLVGYHNMVQLQKNSLNPNSYGVILNDVLGDCYRFLEENKSECIVLQVKKDDGDDVEFARLFIDLIQLKADKWYAGTKIPKLSEVRGKILLVRRFRCDASQSAALGNIGLCDVSDPVTGAKRWPDNAVGRVETGVGYLNIQDNFNQNPKDPVATKWAVVQAHLQLASSKESEDWYINYTSAVAWKIVTGSAKIAIDNHDPDEWIQNGLNALLVRFFRDAAKATVKKTYGTIVMDWADSPAVLIPAIVMSNPITLPQSP